MCNTFILNTDTNSCDKELKMYESAFFLFMLYALNFDNMYFF